MKTNKIRAVGAAATVALWLVITLAGWFSPAKEMSDAERRPLAQFPKLNVQTLLDGKFMSGFESYTLDQFPLRDTFRQIKALFHYNALQQTDNNEIYLVGNHAGKLLPDMNTAALDHNLGRLQLVYDKYLSGSNVYMAVVPDKSYFLAKENGLLSLDYDAFFAYVQEKLPWAEQIDLTDSLKIDDYYFTDTHWRQEYLIPAAQAVAQAMGNDGPKADDFTKVPLERPFYGVYYGQAALPMDAETMYVMESETLSACTVYDHEADKYTQVYDMEKLTDKDLYNVFLSGSRALLTIENPNAETDRELIVFRDSFGSSLVPLLVQDYAKVTVVDIRYLSTEVLGNFVEFTGQDVLMLYSTSVLNSENALR